MPPPRPARDGGTTAAGGPVSRFGRVGGPPARPLGFDRTSAPACGSPSGWPASSALRRPPGSTSISRTAPRVPRIAAAVRGRPATPCARMRDDAARAARATCGRGPPRRSSRSRAGTATPGHASRRRVARMPARRPVGDRRHRGRRSASARCLGHPLPRPDRRAREAECQRLDDRWRRRQRPGRRAGDAVRRRAPAPSQWVDKAAERAARLQQRHIDEVCPAGEHVRLRQRCRATPAGPAPRLDAAHDHRVAERRPGRRGRRRRSWRRPDHGLRPAAGIAGTGTSRAATSSTDADGIRRADRTAAATPSAPASAAPASGTPPPSAEIASRFALGVAGRYERRRSLQPRPRCPTPTPSPQPLTVTVDRREPSPSPATSSSSANRRPSRRTARGSRSPPGPRTGRAAPTSTSGTSATRRPAAHDRRDRRSSRRGTATSVVASRPGRRHVRGTDAAVPVTVRIDPSDRRGVERPATCGARSSTRPAAGRSAGAGSLARSADGATWTPDTGTLELRAWTDGGRDERGQRARARDRRS